MLRKARDGSPLAPARVAPSIAGNLLPSTGQPLDASSRAYFEPRFARDFGHVRIHTGERAAQMALAVQARAFTVGRDIVFGAGEFNPSTSEGKRLLAHELTHTLQQASLTPRLQRACLPGSVCATPSTTLESFVATTQADPVNQSKAAKRQAACSKVPPSPACTSDGHGAPATALTALLSSFYPARLAFISGIFVDKDIPATYGAYTFDCASFVPPRPGTKCTFVPAALEVQARQYRAGATKVGGQPRQAWLTETLGTLTHETEHARFDAAAPIANPSASCKFADHASNLSEMAAHLSEMHVYYRAALARPEKNRFAVFRSMFDYWVKNGSEDVRGIVQSLRCKCSCADADQLIAKTVESVANSQHWTSNEAFMIHSMLRDPKWKLQDGTTSLAWPIVPPIVNAADLPTVSAVPFTL